MNFENLQFLYMNMAQGVMVLDASGRIIHANPSAERILGVSLHQVKGQFHDCGLWKFVMEDGSEFPDQMLPVNITLRTGDSVTNTAIGIIRPATQEHRWIKVHSIPQFQEEEKKSLSLVIITIDDITDQKEAENALQQSEKRHKYLHQEFHSILNGISESLIRIAPNLRIVWANKKAGEIMGQDISNIPGQYCYEFWRDRSAPCEECPVLDCFRTGLPQEKVVTDERGCVFGVKVFPLFDENGRISSVLEHAVDITEKLKLREEAAHQSRLAYLGELAAGVAHEINNPNSHIRINAQILEDSSQKILPLLEEKFSLDGDFSVGNIPFSRLRDEIPRMHREIRESAERIKRIVEDLKNFVHGGQHRERGAVSLNDAVNTAMRLLTSHLMNSTNHFSCTLQEKLPLIHGDLHRLEQVVVNLVINACQALPNRDCGIFVQTRSDLAEDIVQLIVSDEGIGISQDYLHRLTEPFFTTRRNTGGTGLGLSVTNRLIKDHGGTISFVSEPGRGTTITVSFPILTE